MYETKYSKSNPRCHASIVFFALWWKGGMWAWRLIMQGLNGVVLGKLHPNKALVFFLHKWRRVNTCM